MSGLALEHCAIDEENVKVAKSTKLASLLLRSSTPRPIPYQNKFLSKPTFAFILPITITMSPLRSLYWTVYNCLWQESLSSISEHVGGNRRHVLEEGDQTQVYMGSASCHEVSPKRGVALYNLGAALFSLVYIYNKDWFTGGLFSLCRPVSKIVLPLSNNCWILYPAGGNHRGSTFFYPANSPGRRM